MLLSRGLNILFLCLLAVLDFYGQSFFKKYGTEGNDYAESIVMDRDSGFVVVGGTEGIGQGNMDGYFLKIDSAGILQYTRTFGGAEIDRLTDVKVNPTGFIISGYSNSFGLDYDMYVIQTDEEGVTIWEKTIGGASWDFGNAIAALSDGSIILAGDSYTFSNGNSDGYVVKLNAIGDTIWTRHFGGLGKDGFNDVLITKDGNILLIGTITNVNADTDIWLMNLDPNGNEIWSYEFGDSLNQEGIAGTVLLDDEFVITGNTVNGTGTFEDNIFFKIKNTGVVNGVNVINDVAEDYAGDVVSYYQDSSFILVGSGNSIGNGGFDGRVFDCGYNTYGIYGFDYQIGNSFNDFINGADTTYDKGLIVVGTTNETDFGYTSIFINKVDSTVNPLSVYQEEVDLNVVSSVSNQLNIFPNPVTNKVFFNGGELEGSTAEIYSLDGKILYRTSISQQCIAIPSFITAGVYLLKVDETVFKLVKE